MSVEDHEAAGTSQLAPPVYVKNTFLEVAEISGKGAVETSETLRADAANSRKGIWRSLKERTAMVPRSHSVPAYASSGASAVSESSNSRCSSQPSGVMPAGAGIVSKSSSSRPNVASAGAETPTDFVGHSSDQKVALKFRPLQRSFVGQEDTTASCPSQPSAMSDGAFATSRSEQADLEALKKRSRQRPTKANRARGKLLAEMIFKASSDEAKEWAEEVFLRETHGNELLHEYALSVLRKLHAEAADLGARGLDPSSVRVHRHKGKCSKS